MNIKEAKNITKKFIKNEEKLSPIITSDWKFKIINKKVFLNSEILDFSTYASNLENYAFDYAFNENFDIHNNKVSGNYYFTSIGLVSEEKYFEALDYIELFDNPIKKKDLLEESIYLSDKNKEYVYVDEVKKIILHYNHSEFVLKKDIKIYKNLLFDIEREIFVKLSSIKLIKDLDLKLNYPILKEVKYDTNYINNFNEAIYENYKTNISSFWFQEYNNIEDDFSFHDIYYDFDSIQKFINSDSLEFELEYITEEIPYNSSLQKILDNVSSSLNSYFNNYYIILENVEEHITNMSCSNGFISRNSYNEDALENYLKIFFTKTFEVFSLNHQHNIYSYEGLYVILSLLDKYSLEEDLFVIFSNYDWSRLKNNLDNVEECIYKLENFKL